MKFVECTPQRARSIGELPEKIALSITDRFPNCRMIFGIKTTIKPDHHVPIIWAVITPEKLLLCSTNRPNGIWKEFELSKIDTIRQTSPYQIEIIWTDLNIENFSLVLPKNTNPEWVTELASSLRKF